MKLITLDHKSGAEALANKSLKPEQSTEDRIKEVLTPLIKEIHQKIWMEDYRDKATEEQTLGVIIAKYTEWDGYAIRDIAKSAFEDANFRDMPAALDNALPDEGEAYADRDKLMKSFLGGIDFDALRKQKADLVRENFNEGLVNLIDRIQDIAVDEFNYDPKDVFLFEDPNQ